MPLHFRPVPPQATVTIDAPARLHLGFLDPNASLGRAFGSVGLVIDGHGTVLDMRVARPSDSTPARAQPIEGVATELDRARIAHYLERLQARYGRVPVEIDVRRVVRAHNGLGSGTQLALAVGTAYARLVGSPASTAELATVLGRGGRSGIGVHGFDVGGLIVDGGRDGAPSLPSGGALPPLLARQPFPEGWRVLLVTDTSRTGLHGADERRALAGLAPFPQHLAAHLCHLTLLRILPGAADHDFERFATGVSELQQVIGEYFAPAQGGVYASADVAAALRAVAAQQCAGIGQSSWGPTGFAIVASADDAARALEAARDATRAKPHIRCTVVRARNRGASVGAAVAPRPAPRRTFSLLRARSHVRYT